MMGLLKSSSMFGIVLSVLGYGLGTAIQKRFKSPVFNPLLIAIMFVITFLKVFRIDYETYSSSSVLISNLLTPATVCLAIPLYQQIGLLKKNVKAILCGILSGVFASLLSIFGLALLFKLSHQEYVTFLPKSVTSAIGMGLSEEMGGIASITVAAIIVTGIIGSVLAEPLCKLFKINHPIAKGVAIGTSSHAIGTSKALTMGETEGAMSSLALAVAGLCTVILAPFFANFL